MMTTRRSLFLCLLSAALVFLAACSTDDHSHNDEHDSEEYAAGWDESYIERQSGKADQTCSGVTVPDRGGFRNQVALTFDDGPNPETTPKVLDVLKEHGIKATFFINGNRVRNEASRQIVQRIVDEGHVLANHSQSHKNLKNVSSEELERQVLETDAIIREFAGDARYFRFPFGSSSCATAEYVRNQGYIVSGWHVDSADWCFARSTGGVGYCDASTFRWVPDEHRDSMAGYTMSQLKSTQGGIVLFHDIHPNTADQIGPIIEEMKANDYTFTNMDSEDLYPLLHGADPSSLPFVGSSCQSDNACNFSNRGTLGECHLYSAEGVEVEDSSEEGNNGEVEAPEEDNNSGAEVPGEENNSGAEVPGEENNSGVEVPGEENNDAPEELAMLGMCVIDCNGYCPDQLGKAPTFCASVRAKGDEDAETRGFCLSKSGDLNSFCADIPGGQEVEVNRFIGRSNASPSTAKVCLPPGLTVE